jgi:hypothetical protein
MPEPAPPPKHDHVREKARGFIKESWQSQTNLAFFLGLLVTVGFILPSLGFGKGDEQRYSDLVFSLLLASGVAIAWGRRWLFPLAAFVGSVALAVRWMAFSTPTLALQVWSVIWSLAAVIVIALVLLAQVFRSGPVTSYRVQGAIAVYLLFGVGWAHAYHLTELLHPGSFNSTAGPLNSVVSWAYYSYITLSTVGYGDITPVRPIARALSMGEALTGQLYLAVLIARLVAMEVITWQSKTSQNAE